MRKPAESSSPLHELIRERWSPRAFADRLIEPEKIQSLLEAARWAPSSSNGQPWTYLLATKDDSEEFDRLASCLVDGNGWAKRCALLILAVAATHFAHNGKPNRHAFHDVGLANENLVLQAGAMGLVVHQMAGFLPDRARELFEIPEGSRAADDDRRRLSGRSRRPARAAPGPRNVPALAKAAVRNGVQRQMGNGFCARDVEGQMTKVE